MLFVEARFFAFFALVMLIHWALLRRNDHRKLFLLVASYAFYAAWDWRFLGLIVLSTLVDHTVAQRIAASSAHAARRRWLLVSLVVNLGMLGVFKYANFFVDSLQDTLNALGVEISDTTLNITLPVGISFYTFQTLSYTFDVYRGTLEPRRRLLDVATFVAFFPQLVAGPIVRAKEFLPQLETPRRWSDIPWRRAATLVVVGFVKKAVVADTLAAEVDLVFADPTGHSTLGVAQGVAMYSAQIYCDFSGYSDMAIGIALMFGYALGENFRWPYLSASITDFWRRWHISLSSWLRDYLYISLGGNRRGPTRTQINLMITMLLGGLWHGASWTFVVWGGLHGGALIAHRWWQRIRPEASSLPNGLSHGASVAATFLFVSLAWVFFRAPDFSNAADVLGRLVAFEGTGSTISTTSTALLLFAAVGHWFTGRGTPQQAAARLADPTYAAVLGVWAGLAIAMVPVGTRPFIYFQF